MINEINLRQIVNLMVGLPRIEPSSMRPAAGRHALRIGNWASWFRCEQNLDNRTLLIPSLPPSVLSFAESVRPSTWIVSAALCVDVLQVFFLKEQTVLEISTINLDLLHI